MMRGWKGSQLVIEKRITGFSIFDSENDFFVFELEEVSN